MSDLEIETGVYEDRSKARLVFRRADEAEIVLELDANEIETTISALSQMRAETHPPIPESVDGLSVLVFDDYRWNVLGMKSNGRRQVVFRHPHLGWLGFAMPDDDAAKLADWLTRPLLDDKPAGSA